jgi:hypothetical protein
MNLPAGVELVELPPRNPRQRNRLPEWAVKLDGHRVGRIETHSLRGARNPLYFAFGIHPENGRAIRLEGNIDLEERVRVVVAFWRDPTTGSQHLGGYSRG